MKEGIFRVGSGTFCESCRIRIRIQTSEENGIWIRIKKIVSEQQHWNHERKLRLTATLRCGTNTI
jgi:hypothetical protein